MAACAAWLALAAPAAAEKPERKVTLERPGPGPATWDGATASGLNQLFDAETGEPICGDEIDDQCDTTLLRVRVPDDFWKSRGGGVEVSIGDYFPNAASDFDLYVYESNREGKRGDLIEVSAGPSGLPEQVEVPEADGYYLVEVVYFAVTESRYSGSADFVIEGKRAPEPPDVDRPPGIQDVLASDPRRGWRSRSEMSIAQSPAQPRLLVAASKFYNRDPDSLREYEFKIGTYVSFDRGRHWHDLGQTATCKPRRAPPSSWPDNRCYPSEDPRRDGTGEEDRGDRSRSAHFTPGQLKYRSEGETAGSAGQGRRRDYGEEYITSDPWVQFDDEGNAYLMVLDSPPFEHGAGWGMSFHIWKTPSRRDLKNRDKRTWSRKIVINNYANPLTQADFLDDKNTFAVNNAGPNRDGEVGTIVACWGQNIESLVKQQTVCERSRDGGRSWPGEPVAISPPDQQLVIGVSVVADNEDPDRFYAIWLHYTPSVLGAPSEYWFSQSLDGGQTWTPATFVSAVNGIPTEFPGQDFRNLSLPIMAAGPNEGELYATYAEYRNARTSEDIDGQQADIMLVSSTDGGSTWSEPRVVNKDRTDADQFQPASAVTPSGQLNLSWFDRRNDPDNFYIDTYLARSADGGRTFKETRVSHDMWDPEQRPPISPSGEFIGDYQGLAADDCHAYPFVNDTHLANPRDRDPGFDHGLPRSPFQQAITWRVPNKPKFGGNGACPD